MGRAHLAKPGTAGRSNAGSLRRRARETGFTLLEALVALIIVAIGFAGAFGALPESLGAQGKAANLEAATSLAISVLAQDARADGTEGRFAWHIDSGPVPGARPAQSGEFCGQVVRVTVQWIEGRQTRSVRLQTVRLGFLPGSS